MHTDQQAFFQMIEPWRGSIQNAEITYVILKTHDTKLLKYARVIFNYSPQNEDIRVLTEHLDIGRFSVAAANMATLVHGLQQPYPHLALPGHSTIPIGSGPIGFSFFPDHHPEFPGPKTVPCLRISSAPPGTQFPPERIAEMELRSQGIPYDGIPDLVSALALPSNQILSPAYSPYLDVVVWPPAEISPESTLSDGKLVVKVRASLTAADAAEVSLRNFYASGFTRHPAEAKFYWTKANEFTKDGELKITISPPPVATQVFLRYGGLCVQRWWVIDSTKAVNQITAIHRSLDASNALERGFWEKLESTFEGKTSLLLTLLGLNCLHYGQIARLGDNPDIIGVTHDGYVFVVECTVGDIGRDGKILKLAKRVRQISNHLDQSFRSPAGIIGCVFTPDNRSDTKQHWSAATDGRVAIFGRDEIDTLINNVNAPMDGKQLYNTAAGLIPPASEPILPF
jgi:hypothetical protein